MSNTTTTSYTAPTSYRAALLIDGVDEPFTVDAPDIESARRALVVLARSYAVKLRNRKVVRFEFDSVAGDGYSYDLHNSYGDHMGYGNVTPVDPAYDARIDALHAEFLADADKVNTAPVVADDLVTLADGTRYNTATGNVAGCNCDDDSGYFCHEDAHYTTAPVDPFTTPAPGVGYPVPGVDIPLYDGTPVDPFTAPVADEVDTAPVVVVVAAQLTATGIGSAMANGHRARAGHELTGVLVSVDDSGITHIVRSCCTDGDVSFMPDAPASTYVHDGHVYVTESAPVVKVIAGVPSVGRLHSFDCPCAGIDDDLVPTPDELARYDEGADTAPVATTSAVAVKGADTYGTASIAAPNGYTAPGTVRPDAVSTASVTDAVSYGNVHTDNKGNDVAYFARRVDIAPVSALDVYRVTIEHDEDTLNPRADFSNSWSWSLPGDREYNDPDEVDGTGTAFADMLQKYDRAVAFEIARLYGVLHGANVQPLYRSGYDGTLSTSDRTTPPTRVVVAPRSWSLFDHMHGHVDGVAVIPATEIAEQMKYGATGADIRRQLTGEIDTYNDWATGNTFGFYVERARVQTPGDGDEFDEISSYSYRAIDDGSVWGYFGGHDTSGIADSIADAINYDASRSDEVTSASASVQSLHEGAIDTLVTLALQLASGEHDDVAVHHGSPLASAIAVVQTPEFIDRYPFLTGRTDVATANDDAPVWQA